LSTESATILFTDQVGSTELSQRLSAEAADEVRQEHFSLLRQAIAETGGIEVKGLGDGLMVVFGSAAAALACGVAMQQRVERGNRSQEHSVGLRVGLSAGEVSQEHGDYYGDSVVEAARLCARCESGQVLAADVVRAMAGRRSRHEYRSLGDLSLKGLSDPVETLEVLWEPLEGPEPGSPIPLPNRLAGRPSIGFVGRETELQAITDAAKRAAGGEGREILLVSGEAGMGKTTLVAEVARIAFESGAIVLFGHCEEDLAIPNQLFAEALGHYVTHAPESQLLTHVEAHGSELLRLVPSLASRVPNLPPPKDTDTDSERHLLLAAAVGLFAMVSEDQPIVVVLDDLQWADTGSLLLLRHLAAGADQAMRVLVLGTYRDSELSQSHPLLATLADLHRQSGVSRIELSGLDDAGVVTLMEATAGYTLDQAGVGLARDLYRETDGNPFFVSEVLRHLSETGAIYQDGTGRWTAKGSLEQMVLPRSIREVIGARVGRLGPDAARVLSLAAVIGRDFDFDLLVRATGITEDELLEILEAAAAYSLVREVADLLGQYSFAHALIAHTLYQELGGTRQSRAHRIVAEALESIAEQSRTARVRELAHHWFACTGNDRLRGVPYAEKAAQESLSALAYEDATEWFDRALDVAGQSVDPLRHARLQIGLAEAATRAGQQEKARRAAQSAWHMAMNLAEAEIEVEAALLYAGEPELNVVGDEPGVHVLEETLGHLPELSADRARIMARLGSALSYTDHSRATVLGIEAIALARRRGDDESLGYALRCRLRGWFDPDAVAARRHAAEELRSLGSRREDPFMEAWGVRWQASIFEDGNLELIERSTVELSAIATRLNSPNHRWAAGIRHAALMIQWGRFDEAHELQNNAGREIEQLDNLLVQSVFERQRRLLTALSGSNSASEVIAALGDSPAWIFDELTRDPDRYLDADITRLGIIISAAAEVSTQSNPALANAVYPWAKRHVDLIATWNPGVAMLGSMHLYAGLLALGKGAEREGIDHLRAAVQRNEALGAQPFCALALHHLAKAIG